MPASYFEFLLLNFVLGDSEIIHIVSKAYNLFSSLKVIYELG